MSDLSEAEARLLLSHPLRCEGDLAWAPLPGRRGGRILSVGLLDETGIATPLVVELRCMHAAQASTTRYLFSVLIRERYGQQRVYQLEVNQAPREPKDAHRRSHEHIGDLRLIGHARWRRWSYHEVLTHFCARTNITFDPVPLHP
jgi:hypothetical protein